MGFVWGHKGLDTSTGLVMLEKHRESKVTDKNRIRVCKGSTTKLQQAKVKTACCARLDLEAIHRF